MKPNENARRQQLAASLKASVATAAVVGALGGWVAFGTQATAIDTTSTVASAANTTSAATTSSSTTAASSTASTTSQRAPVATTRSSS
ncbi:MAG: hypothetical protein U0074_13405 [Kouleothrix sp.]